MEERSKATCWMASWNFLNLEVRKFIILFTNEKLSSIDAYI